MDNDFYAKHLIPMGEYEGARIVTMPVSLNPDETNTIDLDMVILTVNDSPMSFPSEYAPTLDYVFTCPLLLEVNKWIHEVEEEKLIRNETITRLREQKLLFAVSQDSVDDGLLSQIFLLPLVPVDSPLYAPLNLAPSSLRVLSHSSEASHLSSTVALVAAELGIPHDDVADALADELPELVSGRFVSVHFAMGFEDEDFAPTPQEQEEMQKQGEAYEAEQTRLRAQDEADAEAAYEAEMEAERKAAASEQAMRDGHWQT